MATTNYDINYDDDRFQKVETEKQDKLNEINDTYNSMINQSDAFYQRQIDAAKEYANTQTDLQNQQTQLAIDEINQQKEKAQNDYLREQRGAYSDWQKESNKYGVNAERMAANGLRNTGYSESSQVSMYNTYQNRVSTARESYNLAVQNYDNNIAQARLQNNSKLAEIAYQALQQELELSLNGFQYKNQLLQTQINMKNDIDSNYYQRWLNVLNQMNTENSLKEQIRQYNEQFAYQKKRDKVADKQWQKEYDLARKKASGSSKKKSSGGGGTKLTKGGTSLENNNNNNNNGNGNTTTTTTTTTTKGNATSIGKTAASLTGASGSSTKKTTTTKKKAKWYDNFLTVMGIK